MPGSWHLHRSRDACELPPSRWVLCRDVDDPYGWEYRAVDALVGDGLSGGAEGPLTRPTSHNFAARPVHGAKSGQAEIVACTKLYIGEVGIHA